MQFVTAVQRSPSRQTFTGKSGEFPIRASSSRCHRRYFVGECGIDVNVPSGSEIGMVRVTLSQKEAPSARWTDPAAVKTAPLTVRNREVEEKEGSTKDTN